MLLKPQEEVFESRADAHKAILEAERRVKQSETDEYKRQHLQKYRDECQLLDESNSSESNCNVEANFLTKTSEWVNSSPHSATVDSLPIRPQRMSNRVNELLQQMYHLNEKHEHVVDNVTSQSSFVNNSVGPSLLFVYNNAPSKAQIGSTCVVDSTFGTLLSVTK